MKDHPYAKVRDALTGETTAGCVRRSDGALIPADQANIDWQAYQAWLKTGNTPAEPPVESPMNPSPAQALTSR